MVGICEDAQREGPFTREQNHNLAVQQFRSLQIHLA